MSGYDTNSDTSISNISHSVEEDGVGLANPALSHSRRRLLDLINRLHSTGSVFFSGFSDLRFIYYHIIQCPSGHRPSPNRSHRVTECGQVLFDRVNFWNYPSRATGTCTR